MMTIRSRCQFNLAVVFTTCKNYTRDGTHLTLTRHEYDGRKCSMVRCSGESSTCCQRHSRSS